MDGLFAHKRTTSAPADQSDSQTPTSEPYWTYEDLGAFFFVLVLLNALIRLSIRLHLLRSSGLTHPAVQGFIVVFLASSLYAILKLRYHRPVIAPLGWRTPSKFYTAISILGGVIAALVITYVSHLRGHAMPAIPAMDFLVLGFLLGPLLEESVFRGCLLPVLARTLGNIGSVLATAVLFAAFHSPGDVIHWVWYTATGLSYGWLRLASRTTTAALLMHVACNFTLFLAAKF